MGTKLINSTLTIIILFRDHKQHKDHDVLEASDYDCDLMSR